MSKPVSPSHARAAWVEVGVALASSIGLWLAFPPVGAWPLAWIAPAVWLWLVVKKQWSCQRPYRMLYLTGVAHWLLMTQWIRLPHWSASFGWLVLSLYLALYVPLFVAGARALGRLSVPLAIAAPIVWTGLEWLRSRFLTGFALLLLGHSQVNQTRLIQLADVFGAFGVSFLVMMTCAGGFRAIAGEGRDTQATRGNMHRWLNAAGVVAVMVAAILYGGSATQRVDDANQDADDLDVALIQGALDTQFDGDAQRIQDAFFDYVQLARTAAESSADIDLLIWPESMFTASESMVSYDLPVVPTSEWEGSAEQLRAALDDRSQSVRARAAWVSQQTRVPMIVGIEWNHFRDGQTLRYNSAAFIDADGQFVERYDKMHPVMFGEYVPFGKWLPWLYQLTPMPNGLEPGAGAKTFRIGSDRLNGGTGFRLAPTICFENTVPHLMRAQVNQLVAADDAPDVLVTITNDGWFWGSSLLDLHLACGVFRAIELRRPLLIAANTGFSAILDAAGRIQQQGPRRAEAIVADRVAVPRLPSSLYQRYGDAFAGGCFGVTCLALVSPSRFRRRQLESRLYPNGT